MGKKARMAARQRIAQQREQERQSQRRRKIILIGSAVLAVLVVAGVVTLYQVNKREQATALAAVQTFKAEQGHTDQPVTYAQSPPTGGRHNPVWQNCGVYDQPVKNEHAVHSLEHGAVWVTYRPGLPAAGVTKLRNAVKNIDYALVSPYPGLPAPVVASAWGKQLKLRGPDDERLTAFLRAYVKGPQTPEPGAPCANGTGKPLT